MKEGDYLTTPSVRSVSIRAILSQLRKISRRAMTLIPWFKPTAAPEIAIAMSLLVRRAEQAHNRPEAAAAARHFADRSRCRVAEVFGDRVQSQQVVLNLVVNAIECMITVKDKERRLGVISQQASGMVSVDVHDSGRGLDGATTDHIFDAFFTTKAEGMVLGLAISRSIMKAHGGLLWELPAESGGASFFIAMAQFVASRS